MKFKSTWPLSLFLIILVTPALFSQTTKRGLEEYVGQDLFKYDKGKLGEFRSRIESLTGEAAPKDGNYYFYPFWVRPVKLGEVCWVELEAYPLPEYHDYSAILVRVFNKDWHLLHKTVARTGFAYILEDVNLVENNPVGKDLICVKTRSEEFSNGKFVGDEQIPEVDRPLSGFLMYFAIHKTGIALVRIENPDGSISPNDYSHTHPEKGPLAHKHKQEERIQTLAGDDAVDQLSTMVWLSGEHLPSDELRTNAAVQESVEESKMLERVRESPKTKAALRRLEASKNKWVQEYAKFTLDVISKDQEKGS